ncbi:MAG TPA: SDR family NAD(P)-dependent oxidoreductase [Burkholderiales bacterium]|jgi:NAD(P)-dependent dehydrogenase (short-subunit alcohol dehydrogenase family)|nr:SDR family NAD(P)-dependent oxidoreductase [Burkholderiales bacterium]
MNQLDMNGRSAIVTGGASGIGLGIAKRLAQSGANVSIWDMNEKTMAEAAKAISGVKVHTARVDVTKLAEVEAAFKNTIAAFGSIDALVNSAGVAGKNALLWEYPVEEWIRVHDINLNGTFYTCRTVTPHMIANNYGRIVNIASIAGKEGNPNASAYSSSKAAVIGLTKSLGKELAKYRITVNCVTPAAVKTPIFEQVSQQHIDYMLQKIPMGRFGLVEEIAAMVAWMCTEDCSFTTGAVFDLSGGRATY